MKVRGMAASVPNTHFMGTSTILYILYVWSLLPGFEYCKTLNSVRSVL